MKTSRAWAPTAAYTGPEGVTRDEALLFWLRMLARLLRQLLGGASAPAYAD